MFFIMGITQDQKQLEFRQPMSCPCCGAYGAYQVFVCYNVFTFFFIPLFKWGREYYVRTSCCEASSPLDPEIGRDIESGRLTEIPPEQLHFHQQYQYSAEKQCRNCGYRTTEDFEYCPHCGRKF